MALTRAELHRLALAVSVLTAACEAAAPDGQEVRHSQVRIDLRQLTQIRQQGGPITVIDTVALTLAPANGTEQRLVRHVTSADAPVMFDVTVETGTVGFAAAVLSNNGATLYSAQSAADIRDDGFTVTLQLVGQRPVLTVSPDSIMLIDDTGSFAVANIGIGTLDWDAQLPVGGMEIIPSRDTIPAGSSQVVRVFNAGGVLPGEAVMVRFQSPEGELEAKVQGIPPIFAVAVTPDGGEDDASEFGTGSATFVVRNAGNATDTYAITCAGEIGVVCTGPNPTTIELAAGDSATVTAGYTASTDGTLLLTAASEHASDQGSYTVTCCPAPLRRGE